VARLDRYSDPMPVEGTSKTASERFSGKLVPSCRATDSAGATVTADIYRSSPDAFAGWARTHGGAIPAAVASGLGLDAKMTIGTDGLMGSSILVSSGSVLVNVRSQDFTPSQPRRLIDGVIARHVTELARSAT
jgi:hypothetical protein